MDTERHLCCFFLYALIAWGGCLAPDDGREVEAPSRGREKREAVVTSAPLEIDPAILRDRAFSEAPMLAERVGRGELPPVAQRLPENPLVIVPVEEIGTYGGMLRRTLTGDIVQTPGPSKTLNENLMGFERPFPNGIQHNLAEEFAYADSGRVAVFKIRKGVKWSDGHPFTVDDILFWYYDMTFDDDARQNPFPPAGWMVDGEPLRFRKIDSHTLEISSPKPMGRVLQELCRELVAAPRHVLLPMHPRYNPKASYGDFRTATTPRNGSCNPACPASPRGCPWSGSADSASSMNAIRIIGRSIPRAINCLMRIASSSM